MFSFSSFGGVAVLEVDSVKPLDRRLKSSCLNAGTGGMSSIGYSFCGDELPFFCPKENVLPARFRKLDPLDLGLLRGGTSWNPFLLECRQSSWARSAEEGAVEALLCREEASVDVALVVLEAPLPLRKRSQFRGETFLHLKNEQ